MGERGYNMIYCIATLSLFFYLIRLYWTVLYDTARFLQYTANTPWCMYAVKAGGPCAIYVEDACRWPIWRP